MSEKAKSRTERESWLEERLMGSDGHYKTTITDGKDKVEGRGNTPEEAEARASSRWSAKKR